AEEDPSVQRSGLAQGAREIDGLRSRQAAENEEARQEQAQAEEDHRGAPRREGTASQREVGDGDPAHGRSPCRIAKSSSRLSTTRGPGRTSARERARTTFPSQPGRSIFAPSSMVVSITRWAGSRTACSA